MAKEKADQISLASDKEIKKYEKDLTELCQVLNQEPPLFTSDLAPFIYNYQSCNFNINKSAFKFSLARLNYAYNLDFNSLFSKEASPNQLEIVKFILKNKENLTVREIPEHLKYWGGMVSLVDEDEPEIKTISLGMIILLKEQKDYQRGYALTDLEFAKTNWLKEYTNFLRPGNFKLTFDDGSFKTFSYQEDIYYFLIASASNSPRFRYEKEDVWS